MSNDEIDRLTAAIKAYEQAWEEFAVALGGIGHGLLGKEARNRLAAVRTSIGTLAVPETDRVAKCRHGMKLDRASRCVVCKVPNRRGIEAESYERAAKVCEALWELENDPAGVLDKAAARIRALSTVKPAPAANIVTCHNCGGSEEPIRCASCGCEIVFDAPAEDQVPERRITRLDVPCSCGRKKPAPHDADCSVHSPPMERREPPTTSSAPSESLP